MNRLDHLLVLTLATYGMCYILMYGSLLNKPRNFLMSKLRWFRNLITCPLCTGFWCGLITYNWHIGPIPKANGLTEAFVNSFAFPFACYSAIVCYTAHLITEILLAKAYPSVNASRSPHDDEGVDDGNFQI